MLGWEYRQKVKHVPDDSRQQELPVPNTVDSNILTRKPGGSVSGEESQYDSMKTE